jgi:uncharacterized DUF497 family protein
MKFFDWSLQKNEKIKAERGISFEDVIFSIQHDGLLDILEHPQKNKFPKQRIFIVDINDYAFLVPFVEDEYIIFLKTIIPSRKMTKKYLGEKSDESK